ncbi:hypothetical protein SAMN04487977_101452 [Treponema bryantii]|uniref:Uncharacterized protein n=1 Tax=Treponema bryantii TaxID=163 RepID=A0A1H9ASJ7_9SPIR|nr:hypothetical protein [Treponema bryantii]SEP79629.1 hypothetical protein SAMN04487977_101452 [Treponema bryantii]
MTVSDNGSPMMFGGDGFGGSGFIWAFLIFALLMGNGGFGFGGNGNTNALSADMQRGFDAQNTTANQREILSATNNVYHDVVTNLGDKYSELARDIAGVNAGVSQAIANQCQLNGDLKLQMSEGFGQNRYDGAMNTASINAVTTAQTQKILDVLAQNKIEALQGRVNQLEMQNALCNVVRYPNATTYSAGGSPFCNNCGCNGYPLYN